MGSDAEKTADEIVVELREWLEENPEDASTAYKLALLLITMERFEDALEFAEMCAVLAPTDANALKLLGLARDYNAMIPEAEKILRYATDLDPQDADGWLCLGNHFFQPPIRDYREALKHFSKACTLDPTSSQAQQSRAETLEKLGRASEARAAYLMALQANKENLAAVKGLAALEAREGNLEKAADLYKIYLAQTPDDLDARWTLERIVLRFSKN